MRFHLLLTAVLCSSGALAAIPTVKYTADSLQKSWQDVYTTAGDPQFNSLLDEVLLPDLLVLNPQDLPESIDREGFRAVAAKSGSVLSFFPVKSLTPAQGELLYSRLHKIEALVLKYQSYMGTIEDRNAPQDFPLTLLQRQHGLELERFTANMVLFLTAEKLQQKCQYFSRAQAQAAALKTFESDQLPSGWSSYSSSVNRFIQDRTKGFGRIPAELCQFQTQLGRAENEETVRIKIQDILLKAMNESVQKHEKVIEQRKNALQSVVSKSEVAIPIDKIGALNRGFRDTDSLLMMIKSDLLLLYTDSPTTQSLLKRLEAKVKNLSQGTDLIALAQKSLDTYEGALKPFLVSLEKIPQLPYLTAAQRDKVKMCSNLSQILGSNQDPGKAAENQQNFNNCLLATAALYKEARESFVDDPAQVEFSSKLAMLMNYFPEIPKPSTPRS